MSAAPAARSGAGRVAKAEPDGYTLLLHHIGMATSAGALPQAGLQAARGVRVYRPGHRRADDHCRAQGLRAERSQELIDYLKANKDKVT